MTEHWSVLGGERKSATFTSREQKCWWTVPWRAGSRRGSAQPLSSGQRSNITAWTRAQQPTQGDSSRLHTSLCERLVRIYLYSEGAHVPVMLQPPSSLWLKPWRDDRLLELTGKCLRWQVGGALALTARVSLLQVKVKMPRYPVFYRPVASCAPSVFFPADNSKGYNPACVISVY